MDLLVNKEVWGSVSETTVGLLEFNIGLGFYFSPFFFSLSLVAVNFLSLRGHAVPVWADK